MCAIFFDYRKAFDSVPHLPLIAKLEALQFNEVILRWLTDYLTNRKQYVVVNGAESQPTPVLSGVPQGSILGPLFFLIYIDSLSSIGVSERCCIHLFADDVLLYHPIDFTNDFLTVQEDISKVTEWSKLNHLTLNSAKCKFMIISRKKNPPRPLVPLHLEGESLDLVNSIKYILASTYHMTFLGVITFSMLAPKPGKLLVYSIASIITSPLLQPYYNSINHWFVPILNMPQQSGLHTCRKTNRKSPEVCITDGYKTLGFQL